MADGGSDTGSGSARASPAPSGGGKGGATPRGGAAAAGAGSASPVEPPSGRGVGIREIFDDISLSVTAFLQNHSAVSDVVFDAKKGAALKDLDAWERRHSPYRLPDDFKSLLLLADGLKLTWAINIGSETLPLGCMLVNSLADVTPISDDGSRLLEMPGDMDSVDGGDAERGEASRSRDRDAPPVNPPSSDFHGKSFDLDVSCVAGNVALWYRDAAKAPQVWFRDNSCSWHFIANTFTDYFRLMIMHLGLPSWQYAFTDAGLDPVSKQWFRFLSPERLAIDIENAKLREIHRFKVAAAATASESSDAENHSTSQHGPRRGKPKSQLNLASIEANSKTTRPPRATKPRRPVTAGPNRAGQRR